MLKDYSVEVFKNYLKSEKQNSLNLTRHGDSSLPLSFCASKESCARNFYTLPALLTSSNFDLCEVFDIIL